MKVLVKAKAGSIELKKWVTIDLGNQKKSIIFMVDFFENLQENIKEKIDARELIKFVNETEQ